MVEVSKRHSKSDSLVSDGHLYLIVTTEAIHERKNSMVCCQVDENIHVRQWEFILEAYSVQVSKIHIYLNLFIHSSSLELCSTAKLDALLV